MRKYKLGYSGVVLALVLGAATAPVQGAVANPVEVELPFCAVEIFPIGEQSDADGEAVCFGTPEEVTAFLSGNAARGAAASVAVGTVYKDAGGTGGSLTFFGSSGCSGVTFGFSTVPSGWENSISSLRATNSCWGTVYTATNYGGTRLNCTPFCSALGAVNDAVKSIVFRPTGTLG
ncbi:hypothetical protein ABIE21_002472 [Conyzicola nivalis]|uniref:Uncharacterized protein n=1 Tax=Conyzicola nivalis TaxID=1477021 RepID=A0ABV2QPI0_9MICO